MHTLARIVALGVALLLVGTLGLALQPAKASMDRPTWSAGNFWAYAVFAGSGVPSGNVTFRMDVTGTDSVTLNGTAYPCYHVKSDFKLPIGGGPTFQVFPENWFFVDTPPLLKINPGLPPLRDPTPPNTPLIAGSPPRAHPWPLPAGGGVWFLNPPNPCWGCGFGFVFFFAGPRGCPSWVSSLPAAGTRL